MTTDLGHNGDARNPVLYHIAVAFEENRPLIQVARCDKSTRPLGSSEERIEFSSLCICESASSELQLFGDPICVSKELSTFLSPGKAGNVDREKMLQCAWSKS